MNKLTLVSALLATTQVLGQTCNKNLLTTMQLPEQETPLTETGFQYCKSLQGKDTCCTAETINTFQTKAETLRDKIRDIVAARDQFLVDTRKNFLPEIADLLTNLKTATEAAVTKLQQDSSSEDDISLVESLGNEALFVTDDLSVLISKFSGYQQSRSKCVIQVLNLQAAAWCLACDPNWETQGVTEEGEITLADTVKARLTSACYDFVSQAVDQNIILQVRFIANKLEAYIAALNKIAQGEAGAFDEFKTLMNSNTAVTEPENDNQRPVVKSLPDTCTADNCPLIYEKLFDSASGLVNENVLGAGGELDTTLIAEPEQPENPENPEEEPETPEQQPEQPEESQPETENPENPETEDPENPAPEGSRRVLSGAWAPDADEAGVAITFEDNPGNVENTNSAQMMTGALFCALLAVPALLI